MTQTELNAVIETRLAASAGLLVAKGKEYCHSDSDRLDSFKDQAKENGVSSLVVWAIYFGKHIRAIQAYVKSGVEGSEPIEGRIDDAINYLLLGAALIQEQKAIAELRALMESNQLQLEAGSQAFAERVKRGRPPGSKNRTRPAEVRADGQVFEVTQEVVDCQSARRYLPYVWVR